MRITITTDTIRLAIIAAVVSTSMQAAAQQPGVPQSPVAPYLDIPCAPLDPAIMRFLPNVTLRCGAGLQSWHGGEFGDHVSTLAVDRDGAVRALLTQRDPDPAALITEGRVEHFGSEDNTIYWGLWMPGPMRELAGSQERERFQASVAHPYVGGITASEYLRHDFVSGRTTSSSPVPTRGVVSYELLGSPYIASRDEANFRSNIIDPGPVQSASVQVDFASGTALARIRYSVRSISSELTLNLTRRSAPSTTFDAVSCTDTGFDICSKAELRFYGRQGEHAGLLFMINYNTALAEGARVAARLNNSRGFGAVALKRR
jgi:hypothetical protein